MRLRWRALLECGADLQRQKQNYASDGNDPRLIGAPMPASQPQLTHTNGTALKKKGNRKKKPRGVSLEKASKRPQKARQIVQKLLRAVLEGQRWQQRRKIDSASRSAPSWSKLARHAISPFERQVNQHLRGAEETKREKWNSFHSLTNNSHFDETAKQEVTLLLRSSSI